MAKTCIKCGYERRESDSAPDYECPACGVVYAKAEAAQPRRLPRAPDRMPAPRPAHASAQADAMLQQLFAAQRGATRMPSPYRGMALVGLVAFSVGFASAAGLYSAAEKMKKSTAAAAVRCPK